jgi:hypothetical protein
MLSNRTESVLVIANERRYPRVSICLGTGHPVTRRLAPKGLQDSAQGFNRASTLKTLKIVVPPERARDAR